MRPISIRRQLVFTFTAAILVPTVLTSVAGVEMIRRQVFALAQGQVDSDLQAAKAMYASRLQRLEDQVRACAARMPPSAEPGSSQTSAWGAELAEVMRIEGMDFLTWVSPSGKVLFRAGNPGSSGDDLSADPLLRSALWTNRPASGTEVFPEGALALENPALPPRARLEVHPTPKSLPRRTACETSGMLLRTAAPGPTDAGGPRGVLLGGVLLNGNFRLVDEIRSTVFKEGRYKGRDLGTTTLFLGDVRISTNVITDGGERAVGTLASAEVARAVLGKGRTWRDRAFVVNDWYLSGYSPVRDTTGKIVGMLYVGALEKPFRDALGASVAVFLGIALFGVALVTWASLRVAREISAPVHELAEASRRVAQGDFTPRVKTRGGDELGRLAESFNGMVGELDRVHTELSDLARTLEKRVQDRTCELDALQTELVRAQKLAAVGQLAAGVAHEINNPLTAVLTNSSLLLQEFPGGDPRKEDLQLIVDETLRCRRIVRSLLDFARQSPARKVPMDLNRAAKDVQLLLRSQPSFRDVSLFNHLDPALPQAFADPDQVRQVLVNLYLNAAEAMPEGGQVVTTTRPSALSGFVEITIEDDGEGIPEAIRDRLFEPFSTTKRSGTGLGLAVVYGILEAHGGGIELEPSSPRGTVARVLLPMAEGGAIPGEAGGEPPEGR